MRMFDNQPIKITTWFLDSDDVSALDGTNGRSIQTLLRGENGWKQSDEIQDIVCSVIRCSSHDY